MPSFEIQADIFTRLSVFDSPKFSSNTFKTHKNISLYFKRRYLIIYKYSRRSVKIEKININNQELIKIDKKLWESFELLESSNWQIQFDLNRSLILLLFMDL